MGYSDKLIVTVRCQKCKIEESESAKDSGNTWGGPCWSRLQAFSLFNAIIAHSELHGPEVTSATCNACACEADIKSRYVQ